MPLAAPVIIATLILDSMGLIRLIAGYALLCREIPIILLLFVISLRLSIMTNSQPKKLDETPFAD
jgi:hypothetical protein